ncbi:MAG: hypothetical protein GY866_04400 [Proteobacteria bacterium]|nr:hypothetical protein [Pseudomonadota bacterium]
MARRKENTIKKSPLTNVLDDIVGTPGGDIAESAGKEGAQLAVVKEAVESDKQEAPPEVKPADQKEASLSKDFETGRGATDNNGSVESGRQEIVVNLSKFSMPKKLTALIDGNLYKKVKIEAAVRDMKIHQLVEEALTGYFQNR